MRKTLAILTAIVLFGLCCLLTTQKAEAMIRSSVQKKEDNTVQILERVRASLKEAAQAVLLARRKLEVAKVAYSKEEYTKTQLETLKEGGGGGLVCNGGVEEGASGVVEDARDMKKPEKT
jgi:hypothetical protein